MVRSTTRLIFSGLALLLVGASCLLDRSPGDLEPGVGGSGGDGAGPPTKCTASDQCEPSTTLCQLPACVAGECLFQNKSAGSPCEDGGVCDEEGVCKTPLGESCDNPGACYDAVCVDGFCCETACDEACSSCALPGLEGTCSPHPSGTVSGDCTGSTCDGLGACAAGELTWGVTFGGLASAAAGFAIAPDGMGNSYLLAEVDGSVDFGSTVVSTVASRDVALVKLDAAGAPLWTLHLIPTDEALAYDVAAMSDGGAVGAGSFEGDLAAKVATLIGDGGVDGWVVRFAPNDGEAPLWAKKIGGGGDARVFAVEASPDDEDVLAGGLFTNAVDFGGGVTVDSLGGFDAFVVRLGPTGNLAFHQELRGSGDSGVAEVLFDGDETIAVGSFSGPLMLDDAKTATDTDIYVARLDATGTILSTSLHLDFDGNQQVTGAAKMPDGGLVLVGYYDGAFTVGADMLPFLGNGANTADVFVIRLDPDGMPVWARSFNGSGELRAWDVAVDPAGNVVTAGSFEGDANFGAGMQSSFEANSSDAFLVKLAPDGATHWVRTYGESGGDALYGVGVDASGNAFATGAFEGAVDLETNVIGEGVFDAFVVNLGP